MGTGLTMDDRPSLFDEWLIWQHQMDHHADICATCAPEPDSWLACPHYQQDRVSYDLLTAQLLREIEATEAWLLDPPDPDDPGRSAV